MSHKHVHYKRLETEESDQEDDDAPPTHVQLHNSHNVKGSRWNHIENLDEFFERVYTYQQEHGLVAILVKDIFELIQFAFIVLFTAFIIQCLRFSLLTADTITFVKNNVTGERDIIFSDLFDLDRLRNPHGLIVIILLMAFGLWLFWFYRAVIRFFRFWEIRKFYHEALNITSELELRNTTWPMVLTLLKEAQREHKMNIRKQELTELDVYHRILRFKNYMVAMVNKSILPCKHWIPLFGEKIFYTQGLQFNFELILFRGPRAPFKDSFYLREEYKSAAKKPQLVQDLRFRIAILALVNLIFCPVILLYQILYSFFQYAELLKRQPGVFGRRRWSLYGRLYLRDFNELDHELTLRLNRAYKPARKFMDLFTNPLVVIVSRNVAFITGSLLAVLLALTVIQEDLLTAHNVLIVITMLGLVITICRVFIPDENQVWCPPQLMQQILGEIHYMPDHWKEKPHTVEVYKEFTHVYQFTLMHVIDELLSPLITPFILFFHLRNQASDIVDFLRNFTIEVSGVGDVCSFAEMNIKKHGHPEWLSTGMTRASMYEQAEDGKTEISLMHFSRKNPNWKPSEEGAAYMTQLKESVDELQQSTSGSMIGNHGNQDPEEFTYLTLQDPDSYAPQVVPSSHTPVTTSLFGAHPPGGDSMQWSVWSMRPGVAALRRDPLPDPRTDPLSTSTLDTLHLHQLHDQRRAQPHAPSPSQALRPGALYPNPRVLQSNASIEAAWATEPEVSAPGAKLAELREPLLPGGETREEEGGTGLVAAGQQQRSHARDETVIKMHEEGSSGEQ